MAILIYFERSSFRFFGRDVAMQGLYLSSPIGVKTENLTDLCYIETFKTLTKRLEDFWGSKIISRSGQKTGLDHF